MCFLQAFPSSPKWFNSKPSLREPRRQVCEAVGWFHVIVISVQLTEMLREGHTREGPCAIILWRPALSREAAFFFSVPGSLPPPPFPLPLLSLPSPFPPSANPRRSPTFLLTTILLPLLTASSSPLLLTALSLRPPPLTPLQNKTTHATFSRTRTFEKYMQSRLNVRFRLDWVP